MIAPAETALICGVVFVAALVRSTLGFGEAIVAMPVLALIVPLPVAAPLMALVSVCNGITILVREWRYVSFRAAIWLILPSLAAVPFGVLLLRTHDDRIARGLLAAVLIVFSVWSLRRPTGLALKTDRWAPLAGLLAGFLGGAYNTSGPPLVIYGSLREWPPERFRAMLQSCFSVLSLWVVSMHAANGLMTRRVLLTFLICVPVVLCAAAVGAILSRRLPTERFIVAVHIALLVMGLVLMARVVAEL